MSDVNVVSGGRLRAFQDEELDAMRRDDTTTSTSAIVNKARRDAGYKEPDTAVRGDDRTLGQVLDEGRTQPSKAGLVTVAGSALDAYEVGHAVIGGALAAPTYVGYALTAILPVGSLIAAHAAMYEMETSKAEKKDGATRDQLHAAILDNLAVPAGFKDAELKKLGVSMTAQTTAVKTSKQFNLDDAPLVARLQLHCDQGMNAARDMIQWGNNKSAFMQNHPAVATRYAEDVAFKNGFDALTWAKSDTTPERAASAANDMLASKTTQEEFLKTHPDVATRYNGDSAFHSAFDAVASGGKAPPSTYDATKAALELRDSRYDKANIHCRIPV